MNAMADFLADLIAWTLAGEPKVNPGHCCAPASAPTLHLIAGDTTPVDAMVFGGAIGVYRAAEVGS